MGLLNLLCGKPKEQKVTTARYKPPAKARSAPPRYAWPALALRKWQRNNPGARVVAVTRQYEGGAVYVTIVYTA